MTTRRSFLTACIATVAAPAIVRASSLMPVSTRINWCSDFPIGVWVLLPNGNESALFCDYGKGFKITSISRYGQSITTTAPVTKAEAACNRPTWPYR